MFWIFYLLLVIDFFLIFGMGVFVVERCLQNVVRDEGEFELCIIFLKCVFNLIEKNFLLKLILFQVNEEIKQIGIDDFVDKNQKYDLSILEEIIYVLIRFFLSYLKFECYIFEIKYFLFIC